VPIDPREWLEQHGLAEAGSADQSVRQLSEPSNDDADAEAVARSIALRKLTARPRTRHELDQALQAKNVPPSVKKAVLDRMQEVGLVDDASFAADWVASRQQRRHLSRRALRRELESKGVERSDIDSALNDVDFDSELTTARDLVATKRATMSGLARDVQYRRLAGILGRRGFDTAVTVQVLNELLGPVSGVRHT
jgi:regulatory protein